MNSSFWSGEPSSVFDEWAEKRIAMLRELPDAAHIHIIGICGTGTGALLQLLVAQGYRVSGSDKAFYPPMGDIVRSYAAEVFEGYSEASFARRPDCVIIGNTASVSNPEVEYVLANGLPFCSMPEALAAFLIGSREFCPTSIVISGTHGKTTTTALTTFLFEVAGRKPAYFIGGVSPQFKETIRGQDLGTPHSERVCILEGDEYNSAFFARYSKFHAYRPDLLIVTSLEFDHGDIFDSLTAIEREFEQVIARMPAEGTVLLADTYPRLRELRDAWQPTFQPRVMLYGESEGSAFRILARRQDGARQVVSLSLQDVEVEIETELSGPHNAMNLCAAAAAAQLSGLTADVIARASSAFHGVKRRQQLIFEGGGVRLIEDFAHHPTAIEATLQGLRERFAPERLLVAFDPRSNTSRRHFFQERFAEVFDAADMVFLKQFEEMSGFSLTGDSVPLDLSRLAGALRERGRQAEVCPDAEGIAARLLEEVRAGDLLVLMSNGSFEGLPQKLPSLLDKKMLSA